MRLVVLAVIAGVVAASAAGAERPPQCADGRDNDGDGLVDWRRDSGCGDRSDDSESTPLRCELQQHALARRVTVSGRCTGPFAAVEIRPPPGVDLVPPLAEARHAHG